MRILRAVRLLFAVGILLGASAGVSRAFLPPGTPSTTVLSPNPTTAYTASPNNAVTLTATVTAAGSPTGTVTFKDGSTNLVCSGGNPAVLSNGQATCVTAFTTEGVHALSAVYGGDSTFITSTGNANVFIQKHATNTGTTYCNAGAVSANGGSASAYSNTTPYPSVIFVGDGVNTDITGSVSTVSLRLTNFSTANDALNSTHMLLVAPDGSHAYDFWSAAGTNASSGNYTIEDGAIQIPVGPITPGTYGPTASTQVPDVFTPGPPTPAPQLPSSFLYAAPNGTASFLTAFNGAAAHGAWKLYLYDSAGAGATATAAGGWCITITSATGDATTTTVVSNPSPFAALGQAVTFTATVSATPTPNQGTVTFMLNGAPLPGAPNNGVANVSAGAASISTSGLPEGDNTVKASFHDSTGTFNDSFGTVTVRVDKATSTPTLSSSTWTYCNTGAIKIPAGTGFDLGAAQPNPSNITVSNLPGTISTVSVTLNNLLLGSNVPVNLGSLLVGPNGANAPTSAQTLDFFTHAGGSTAFGPQTTEFGDAFSPVSNVAPGTHVGPASYSPATSFTSSAFFTLPGSIQHAAPEGASTFGAAYAGEVANGIWSLYFNQEVHATGSGASGGWCLGFVENPVTGTGTTAHVGPAPSNHMRQGGTGSVTLSLLNNGDSGNKGPTGDPDGNHALFVTGTLPAGLTLGTVPTGAPWNCIVVSQTVTCKSDSAIAAGSSYPPLTLPVNVAVNAPSSVVVSGFTFSGAGMTTGTFAADTITIDPSPVLAITKSHLSTFTQGSTAGWNIQVSNNSGIASGATDGSSVTVTDTLPTGYTLASYFGTGWNCTGTTAISCISTQVVAGAGGEFPLLSFTVNVPANSPVSVTNTAKVFGGGDLTHTNSGNAATSQDTVTVVQVPASISINGLAAQLATVGMAFGSLAVTVKDAAGAAIPSYPSVVFTATTGSNGQSGTFSNSAGTKTVSTNTSGVADPGTFTANSKAGTYSVGVTAGSATKNFSLTNTAGLASSMTANSGATPQSAGINTAFTNALAVTVKDGSSNPVSGVNVAFTAPSTGASGKFSNNTATITVATNASGIASAPFTANGTAGGPYNVTAASSGLTTVNFSLTNTSTAATVTNLTSTTANGSYTVGALIPITITFSKLVNVTGSPQLALNSGGMASYSSGTGTTTLIFNYTVAAGQSSSKLDATSTTALSLNGGTITDAASHAATLTLPTPGAAGSLGANKSIAIDTVAPTVTNLTSTTANGTYTVGALIPITITFSKLVNVTGSPQLALNSGGTASYSSGTGTTTLIFNYTVAAGQSSSKLDATSTTALSLNGGTITDAASQAATLTLPTPGAAGSLGANKSIAIDTTAPTVASYSVLFGGQSYNVIGSSRNRLPWQISGIQVTFSKPIAQGNASSLSGVTPTAFSGLGTNTLTWSISPVALGSLSTTLAGSGPNALKDAAGNALAGGAGFTQALKILEGDFNDDGIVNAQDFVLINNARSAAYNIFADINGDGVVNLTDVTIARGRNGTSLP